MKIVIFEFFILLVARLVEKSRHLDVMFSGRLYYAASLGDRAEGKIIIICLQSPVLTVLVLGVQSSLNS